MKYAIDWVAVNHFNIFVLVNSISLWLLSKAYRNFFKP